MLKWWKNFRRPMRDEEYEKIVLHEYSGQVISSEYNVDDPDAYPFHALFPHGSGTIKYIYNGEVVEQYEGPETMWVFIDKATNKIAPAGYMEEEQGMDFNAPINLKKVLVDCREYPIICSLMEADVEEDEHETITETLPNGVEYVTYVDPDPHHTYEKFDIECNNNDEFIKVASSIKGGMPHYPWKQPHITWAHLRRHRTSLLGWSDDKTTSDMPTGIKTEWATYRQALRDIPVSFGDSFAVDITAGGSNYEVGDKIKFAKADLDNFIIADHLIATVKTVNSGAITALTLSSNQAINDGKDIVEGRAAKEFAGATFTYEAKDGGADAGTGATFKVHKCQRYAAWKVDVPRSPCGTA